jgi:hypothetical protein
MPYSPLAFTNTTATVTAGSEQVLATTPVGSSAPVGGQGNLIHFTLFHTPNATAGTVTYRVRQGSGTGGTAVYTSAATQVPGTASVPTELSFDVLDVAAETVGVAQYTITANYTNSPTAVTVTGTVTQVNEQD